MDNICKNKDFKKNPAMMSALLQYLAIGRGKNISVMMPYADSLKYIAALYNLAFDIKKPPESLTYGQIKPVVKIQEFR